MSRNLTPIWMACVLLSGAVWSSCKDSDCQKLENITWTCASRYCAAGGAGTAQCQCWAHDAVLGGWTTASCQDGLDNDGDGFTDCDDPDCWHSEACQCNDGEDNDDDGLTDCDDPDCTMSGFCCQKAERAVSCCCDGIDNDGDGLTDCEQDPDCAGVCCDDGIDNDGDGRTDCDDPDCSTAAVCCSDASSEACACDDSQDNDGDGLTDCQDPDCASNKTCWDPRNATASERIPYCVNQATSLDETCDSDRASDQLVTFDCPFYEGLMATGLLGSFRVTGFVEQVYDGTTDQMLSEDALSAPIILGPNASLEEVPLKTIDFFSDGWFDSNISQGTWEVAIDGTWANGAVSIRFLNESCLTAATCDESDPTSWRKTFEGDFMAYKLNLAPKAGRVLLGSWSNADRNGDGVDDAILDAVVLKHQDDD
ncbi:MAG: hypothetical protein J7M25_17245 [Deltaproteobacteria bacterium]|nr:hypothetical protein [Deltaproteobacteria bacterium]